MRAATDGLRWLDSTEALLRIDGGVKVLVVAREADKVRVLHEQTFVWVPVDALSPTEPAATAPAEAPAPR
jgi:hypothetical protein